MLLNFSLVLSSSAETLYSGIKLHLHLTILASFFSGLIPSSSLTGQVSLPCSIMLRTYPKYNLPFAPKGKPPLAYRGTKCLNLNLPLIIIVITLPNAPSLLCHQDDKTFPQFQEIGHLTLYLENPLLRLFAELHMLDI